VIIYLWQYDEYVVAAGCRGFSGVDGWVVAPCGDSSGAAIHPRGARPLLGLPKLLVGTKTVQIWGLSGVDHLVAEVSNKSPILSEPL
jgi:hypothetical protein